MGERISALSGYTMIPCQPPRQDATHAASCQDGSFPLMSAKGDGVAVKRLDSWKEIAAFFGRGERTVKRWEVERGLPVHRLPGSRRSAVFAYSQELSEWLKGGYPDTEPSGADPSDALQEPAPRIAQTSIIEISPATSTPAPTDDSRLPSSKTSFVNLHMLAWLAVLGLTASLITVYFLSRNSWHVGSLAKHSSNAQAQELYLKGRYFWNRRTPDDLNRAIDYFTQAIVKDPGDAQAYVGLADCYNLLREFGAMPPAQAYPRAHAAAQRAVQLDSSSAEAQASLAFSTFWWSWQAASAEREFKRALQLDPDFVRGHHWYATYLMALNRFPEALEQLNEAQRLDPSSAAILADKGYLLWCLGRHSDALTLLEQLAASEPTLSSPHSYLGRIYWEQRDYSAAIGEWKRVAELRHDDAGLAIAQASAKGVSSGGLRGLLQSELPLQKAMVDQGRGSAYDLASIYAQLGRKKEALTYLQVAFDRHEAGLITFNPPIPALQNEPEYQKLKAEIATRETQ